ncbi:pancreatic secretory granule membrane major glycoprotein GP2-like [Dreissena polymorpha]|uniref:UMOD/GP2/OIT3-like D8C domain-containing protein n=1 Tax=Dreissena polymorpha TaxID=45954 RepID=A0A9D4L0I8_DREPO|nr:pancreatic secretory granule membrane major glycoprotein GP2-like [Dreissena polymorpha]KAH3849054.1 hypothetical protein DPMN_091443 [Dreissena polymorpha]
MEIVPSFVVFFLLYKATKGFDFDPCVNHTELKIGGSRNEKCKASEIQLDSRKCDQDLPSDWYVTANATLLTDSPIHGNCGADTALWLKDALPGVSEGIANKTICAKEGNNTCSNQFNIQIKNCSTFYVYYLERLSENFTCPTAYCFESTEPCTPPATIIPTASTGVTNIPTVTAATTASTTATSQKLFTTSQYRNISTLGILPEEDKPVKSSLIIPLTISLSTIFILVIVIMVIVLKMNISSPISPLEETAKKR